MGTYTGVLVGIGRMLVEARALAWRGGILYKKDFDGAVWTYRWEDTVEADLLAEVGRLLREKVYARSPALDSLKAQHPLGNRDERFTASDARELDHWLLYRARSWQHGHDLKKRRRRGNAGEGL